jgi:hypothetical protein
MADERTTPSTTTSAAEAEAALAAHDADRQPTPEEERRADENDLNPEVADSYREAIETGADVKGEGSLA